MELKYILHFIFMAAATGCSMAAVGLTFSSFDLGVQEAACGKGKVRAIGGFAVMTCIVAALGFILGFVSLFKPLRTVNIVFAIITLVFSIVPWAITAELWDPNNKEFMCGLKKYGMPFLPLFVGATGAAIFAIVVLFVMADADAAAVGAAGAAAGAAGAAGAAEAGNVEDEKKQQQDETPQPSNNDDEEAKKKEAAAAAEQKRRDEEAAAAAEQKRRQEEEAAAAAEQKRRQDEEAAAAAEQKRRQDEEDAAAAKKKADEEEAARQQQQAAAADEEAARQRAADEEAARQKASEEEAARQRAAEEEAARQRAAEEEEARKKAEEEEARKKAEEEEAAARKKAEEEAAAQNNKPKINWKEINAKLPYDKKNMEQKRRRFEMFDQIDTNGTGKVSLSEMRAGMEAVLGLGDEIDVPIVIKTAFDKAKVAGQKAGVNEDASGGDFIEKNEFRLFLMYTRMYFEMFQLFSELDETGDMRIELGEFEKAIPLLKTWGAKIDDAAETFKQIDKNGGGKVLFGEFVDWALSPEQNLDCPDEDE